MTENTETPQLPDADADQVEAEQVDKAEQTGHALYDVTLQRFVGPVRKSKAEAGKDKANAAKGHKVEVRAV